MTDAKSSLCLWQGELIKYIVCAYQDVFTQVKPICDFLCGARYNKR